MPGRVEAIFVKRVRRGPMDRVERGVLVAARGLEGSADQGGRRQVSVLGREGWEDALEALGASLDPGRRRANLVVSGVDLERTRGAHLRVGRALLKVGGELTPCERMEEALPGLEDALRRDWRGGVHCEVVEGAEIAVGDPVAFVPAPDAGQSFR
ncbi:MAG: MOSC domain-containing protein [Anaeromyxobacter sp.]